MNLTELFLRFSMNYGAEWVMWLLVGLSSVSFYLIIERTIFFVRFRTNLPKLSTDVSKLLVGGDYEGLAKRLSTEKGVVARILSAGVHEVSHGPNAVEQALSGEKVLQRLRCEQYLAILATIGNNAPFLGLFGTVIGVLVAFHRFSGDMTGGAGAIMSDISEALAATAIGLFVAIPAVAAFNTFQRRTKGLLSNADALSAQLMASLRARELDDKDQDGANE